MVAWLARELGLGPGRRVLDLAAGTGKLTVPLHATGAEVVAVDPSEPMLAALRSRLPNVTALTGAAEAIPLPADDVDAATVAQAFHWFDGPRALAELHRVLRPNGRLALIWNERDLSQPLQAEITDLLEPHRENTPAHRSGAWRAAFEATSLFGPLREHTVPFEQPVTPDELVDRAASISFVAALPDARRGAVLDDVRALAVRHPGEPLRYVARIHVAAACTSSS